MAGTAQGPRFPAGVAHPTPLGSFGRTAASATRGQVLIPRTGGYAGLKQQNAPAATHMPARLPSAPTTATGPSSPRSVTTAPVPMLGSLGMLSRTGGIRPGASSPRSVGGSLSHRGAPGSGSPRVVLRSQNSFAVDALQATAQPPNTARGGSAAQVVVCKLCGHENPPDARFCDRCGTGLEAPPPSPAPVASGGCMNGVKWEDVSRFAKPDESDGAELTDSPSNDGGGSSPSRRVKLSPSKDQGFSVMKIPTELLTSGNFAELAKQICEEADADGSGSISALEFMNAVSRNRRLSSLLVPGADASDVLTNPDTLDRIMDAFHDISGGRARITYSLLTAHLRGATEEPSEGDTEMRAIFNLIDKEGSGSISKLHLMSAVQREPAVDRFVLPSIDRSRAAEVMGDQEVFDATQAVFEAIAGGKKRIEFAEFAAYFRRMGSVTASPSFGVDRGTKRVLIIELGFGRKMNPAQAKLVEQAGYQIKWIQDLPNPEDHRTFPGMQHFIPRIKAEVDDFEPDLIACASKGGGYLQVLWEAGYWRGPSLMINLHPTVRSLPKDARIVVAHGSNDECYPYMREQLEETIQTGSANQCFLYYTANSGQLRPGVHTRYGDCHNMASILTRDCLPRLIDAALCGESPELHMVRGWRDRLPVARIEAERWLGHCPEKLKRLWVSPRRRRDERSQVLFEVSPNGEEYRRIVGVMKAMPREKASYCGDNYQAWEQRRIIKIERVENRSQEEGSAEPYYETLRRDIYSQGIDFEPGVHTVWAFHGTDAIDSIIHNPVNGFQPLASGTRGGALWGSGTYFARDAKYCAEGGFCKPGPSGHCQMLMCLLATGMSCLGSPNQHGVLPIRQGDHRYNSSVDSLSSPEIYIVQQSGAAYPAYLITFEA